MEVHKAQAFLVLAEELHFGRAAERLHMAQPPLSRLIRQLEADLGAPLFARNTRQVSLTPHGEALLEPARELVLLSGRMKDIVRRSVAGELGRVRLGFAGASVSHFVGELARRLRRERPQIFLELLGSQFSHLGLEKLHDGALDLLIGRWDYLPAFVQSRVLGLEELLIALPDYHPLARAHAVDPADLADERWIVLPGSSGATLPNRLNAVALGGGFVPGIAQVAPDSSTQLMLVGAGGGVALTFSGVRDNVPARGVVFKTLLPATGPVEVRLAWRGGDPNPVLSSVVGLSERLFPSPDADRPRSP